MSTCWYYTTDRKTRNGPIPLDHLQQLIAAGRLLPTDLVLREGERKWVAVESAIELPIPDNPDPTADNLIRPRKASWTYLHWTMLGVTCTGTILAIVLFVLVNSLSGSKMDAPAASTKPATPLATLTKQESVAAKPTPLPQDQPRARREEENKLTKAPPPGPRKELTPPPKNSPRVAVTGYVMLTEMVDGAPVLHLSQSPPMAGFSSIGSIRGQIQAEVMTPPIECRFAPGSKDTEGLMQGERVLVTGLNVGNEGVIILDKAQLVRTTTPRRR